MAIDILMLSGNTYRPQTDRMLVLQGVDTYKAFKFLKHYSLLQIF